MGDFASINPYADIEREARALRACQLLSIGGASASLTVGLLLVGWPGRTPLVVAALLGAWLLASGVLRLAESVAPGCPRSALPAAAGVVQVVAGLACLRGLLASPAALAVAVGLAGLAAGISELVPAVAGVRGGWARSGAFVSGLLGLAGGLALALWPSVTVAMLALAAGAWLLALGLVQAALAARAARPPAGAEE